MLLTESIKKREKVAIIFYFILLNSDNVL